MKKIYYTLPLLLGIFQSHCGDMEHEKKTVPISNLYKAIKQNSVEKVREIIPYIDNINQPYRLKKAYYVTPLEYACNLHQHQQQSLPIINEFLNHPKIEIVSAVHLACKNNHQTIIQIFLEKFPQCLALADEFGTTGFHVAARYASIRIFRYCFNKATDENIIAKIRNGNTVAHEVCIGLYYRTSSYKALKLLLLRKADFVTENDYGTSPLDIYFRNPDNNTPQSGDIFKQTFPQHLSYCGLFEAFSQRGLLPEIQNHIFYLYYALINNAAIRISKDKISLLFLINKPEHIDLLFHLIQK